MKSTSNFCYCLTAVSRKVQLFLKRNQKCRHKREQYFTERFLPVVEKYVGAFDVSVQEVFLVAVVQTFHQLPHEAADVIMGELDQAGLQKAHQVMVHVLKHQVKHT